jgi:hypothetical protein
MAHDVGEVANPDTTEPPHRSDGTARFADVDCRLSNYCGFAGAAGAAGDIASVDFFAFLAMCFFAFFAGLAGAVVSEAAGAAPGAAGAVVSVWARAASGANAIAAQIPIAANVFSIVQSPCESFDSGLAGRGHAPV